MNRTNIDYPFVKAYRVEPALMVLGETKGSIDYVDVRIYDHSKGIDDLIKDIFEL